MKLSSEAPGRGKQLVMRPDYNPNAKAYWFGGFVASSYWALSNAMPHDKHFACIN